MKIYELGPLPDGELFFPTSGEAIKEAKFYGEGMYVIEHEIGRLTKAVACRLASGRNFSISNREIWTASARSS